MGMGGTVVEPAGSRGTRVRREPVEPADYPLFLRKPVGSPWFPVEPGFQGPDFSYACVWR